MTPSPSLPPTLRRETADGVVLLTIDRPDALGAFDDDLWDGIGAALTEARGDDDVRCVVLTGTGRAFTAGQDLAEMAAPRQHDDGRDHGYRGFMPVLEEFDKPLVAAVNGMAVGIGTTLLPFCDVVLASTEARFKVPFMPLGVTTEAAGSLLLPERMGWQRAARMIFTASWLSAAEAQEAGLVLEVVEPDALVPSALELARTIAAMPLDSLVTTKRLMMAAHGDAVRAARQREDAEFARMVGSAANAAALASFSKG